jgi:hypothetical protein
MSPSSAAGGHRVEVEDAAMPMRTVPTGEKRRKT